MHLIPFISVSDASDIENYKLIQNPVKLLRWSFLQKQLVAINSETKRAYCV